MTPPRRRSYPRIRKPGPLPALDTVDAALAMASTGNSNRKRRELMDRLLDQRLLVMSGRGQRKVRE